VSYVRDPDGQLIGIRVGTSTNATRYYFTFDGLGSITGLTDSTGARVNAYRYDPYGQLLSSTEGLPQPFRYTGGIHDSATGLTKLGIRYYDPHQGRFTQPDPTGQDPHYTYAGNSPCTYSDPSGDSWQDYAWECAIGGALGATFAVAGAAISGGPAAAPGLVAAASGCAQGLAIQGLRDLGGDDAADLVTMLSVNRQAGKLALQWVRRVM
jgi:RHS repeat-associated protein